MYRHSEAQIQCRLFSKNSHKNSWRDAEDLHPCHTHTLAHTI
jgi:hypothetical protein